MVRDMGIEKNWNCKNHERAIVIDKKSEEDIFENKTINDLDDQVANDLQIKFVCANTGGKELGKVELMQESYPKKGSQLDRES